MDLVYLYLVYYDVVVVSMETSRLAYAYDLHNKIKQVRVKWGIDEYIKKSVRDYCKLGFVEVSRLSRTHTNGR